MIYWFCSFILLGYTNSAGEDEILWAERHPDVLEGTVDDYRYIAEYDANADEPEEVTALRSHLKRIAEESKYYDLTPLVSDGIFYGIILRTDKNYRNESTKLFLLDKSADDYVNMEDYAYDIARLLKEGNGDARLLNLDEFDVDAGPNLSLRRSGGKGDIKYYCVPLSHGFVATDKQVRGTRFIKLQLPSKQKKTFMDAFNG